MAGPLQQRLLRPASEPSSLLLVVAVAASLARVADQPSLDLDVAGTDVSLVPADLAFAALAAAVALRLVRRRGFARPTRWIVAAAAAFATWLMLSALANGAGAIVAAGRLVELGVLGLGVVVLVTSREQLWLLVATLVAGTAIAVAVGLVGFVSDPGARQGSFLGEHDLAALSSLSLSLGLAALYARHDFGRPALVAGIAGALGIVLGAALASLLGLYLAALAVVGVAAVRRSVTARALLVTVLVVGAVTAGTLAQRSGELGFLRFLAQEEEERPGEFAASWSQRLIFAYVGLRVFEDNPVVGSGWYPNLPPSEYARFLPDARERFSDQPARYFPPADGEFIPQQTPDQVLYELGLVGAVLFLLVVGATIRSAARTARAWPREDDELLGYLPAAWTGAIAGALAGGALFGGTPLAALFWLTLGTVAATASLAPRAEPAGDAAAEPTLAKAAR
jgi:hypothetical protein